MLGSQAKHLAAEVRILGFKAEEDAR